MVNSANFFRFYTNVNAFLLCPFFWGKNALFMQIFWYFTPFECMATLQWLRNLLDINLYLRGLCAAGSFSYNLVPASDINSEQIEKICLHSNVYIENRQTLIGCKVFAKENQAMNIYQNALHLRNRCCERPKIVFGLLNEINFLTEDWVADTGILQDVSKSCKQNFESYNAMHHCTTC